MYGTVRTLSKMTGTKSFARMKRVLRGKTFHWVSEKKESKRSKMDKRRLMRPNV